MKVIEDLIGFISSKDLIHGLSLPFKGYTIAIFNDRIIGARTSFSFNTCAAYLGKTNYAKSNINLAASEDDRRRALSLADKIIRKKEFELKKEEIDQIRVSSNVGPDFGYVRFKTATREIMVHLMPKHDRRDGGSASMEFNVLVSSLLEFASDRFYDDFTGNLVVNEWQKD
jgi:hypothetical protein